jgi:hypothetical protein
MGNPGTAWLFPTKGWLNVKKLLALALVAAFLATASIGCSKDTHSTSSSGKGSPAAGSGGSGKM